MLEIENEEETYKVKYEFRLEFAYQRNKDKTVLKQHTLKVGYPRFPQNLAKMNSQSKIHNILQPLKDSISRPKKHQH